MTISIMRIFKLDTLVEGISKKDGSKYSILTCQVALLSDSGEIEKVGRMRLSDTLKEKAKPGVYRVSMTLGVATYGNDKGDIVSLITDLVPLDSKLVPVPVSSLSTVSASASK